MGFFLLRMASFFSFVTAHLCPAHLRTAAMPPGYVSIFFLFSLALKYAFHGQSIRFLVCSGRFAGLFGLLMPVISGIYIQF